MNSIKLLGKIKEHLEDTIPIYNITDDYCNSELFCDLLALEEELKVLEILKSHYHCVKEENDFFFRLSDLTTYERNTIKETFSEEE